MLEEEGLENSWQRHSYHHHALRAGIEAMGMSFIVPEADRLPQLNAVTIPEVSLMPMYVNNCWLITIWKLEQVSVTWPARSGESV